MLSILMNPGQEVLIGLMFLASFRVYLEIIGFDFLKLPMTRQLAKSSSSDHLRRFHRMGLIFSVGFMVLFAPQLLMAT
jgi:hypothetical protein